MGFFDSLFGRKQNVVRSLEGIALGMTRREVMDKKGRPLKPKNEVVNSAEIELWAYDTSSGRYWFTVVFINDRVARAYTTAKYKPWGGEESIL